METDIKKLRFLVKMLGQKRSSSTSSFESLLRPDISSHLKTMLCVRPLAEDTYLCDTSAAQADVERTIREIYEELFVSSGTEDIHDTNLDTELHLKYIETVLNTPLPSMFYVLDSNHSWMIYWLVNAHVMLSGDSPSLSLKKRVSEKISTLIIDNGLGGISGGPNDLIGHVASTYAAVLALALVDDYTLLSEIAPNLQKWFTTLKDENGSFAMHYGGEKDTRSTYCVLVVTSLLGIATPSLMKNTQDWILLCQTYEGGFSGVPGAEAHGGYTFCAIASLYLLPKNGLHYTNLATLIRWLAARQKTLEGGFSGRSNKLVDACYSFWIGACFVMLESFTSSVLLFNRHALKSYILNCCQDSIIGGLRDKPGKRPDFYHTNYTLCGLSIAEHIYECEIPDGYHFRVEDNVEGATYTLPVNPVFGLPMGYLEKCRRYFIERE
ncbi:terpenoid cyclases/Protein prenyltransferase [Metschnikowia bicuspidata var. bicuspidata NRRL YB-4993]|uniref:Protein farnesyltransferase subunit beta n=1 Tax=Metschnikowia bicuspidata var. bicuspidata NRRL YB-4993 TaxID=869754 RepID=A0A1A0HH89_9ASCO|nr:terpenoid cyclases/Protein prenyltransferase [Metschnikowia bicuspidata var. bicuspidata NRRL YB-4993]OBA23365.1 terpenoid cyclases/Protein prenyltransferase [Metschnikowia bicuspidata var. bicuspidata NRRL YB-4993]